MKVTTKAFLGGGGLGLIAGSMLKCLWEALVNVIGG